MDSRAQTALEYILLLSGILMLVIIVFTLWQSRVYNPSAASIENKMSIYRNLTNVS